MNYSILSAWTQDFAAGKRKVESVWMGAATLRISFADKTDLVILAASEAFAFHSAGFQPPDEEHKTWEQLIHAILTQAEIDPNDRVIRFHFEQTDIYQQKITYQLIAELTSPKPNLILARGTDTLVIVDALRKYSYADNPQRQVLPKLPYQPAQTSYRPVLREDLTFTGFNQNR